MDDKELYIDGLKKILTSSAPRGRQKEQVIQDYLEQHSCMIPTNLVLNHQVLFDFLFSKFPINNSNKTDLLYVTKSSVQYRVVLIELENSDKKIFTKNLDNVVFSSEFNAALQQVRNWKIELENNDFELRRNLDHLLIEKDMSVEYKFQLIIGRSSEYVNNKKRQAHIANLERESGINILTYDSLINWYRHTQGLYYRNILKLDKDRYVMKYMDASKQYFFSKLLPSQINLTEKQKNILEIQGYQIKDWEKGKYLVFNLKYSSFEQLQDLTGVLK